MSCQYENCSNLATYGLSYGNATHCKNHRTNELKLVSQFCKTNGCNKRPGFNYENSKGKLYCFEHKKDGMISKDNRKCLEENCILRPSFNYEGEDKPIYCFNHKLENMIDITNKKCEFEECTVRPTYNYENENKPIYCYKHKLENMINIVNKKCEYEDCNKIPSYNYKNELGRRYCFNHKLDGMISKDNRKCLEENCTLRPTYNYEDEDNPIYCSKHKLENMVNIINKKCEFEGCIIKASFNFENENKPIYCSKHKLENMVNIINKKCEFEGCNLHPSFNFENELGRRFCFNHKLDGMVSKDNRKCISNLCFGTRGNKNYNGYCAYCFQNLFPDDPLNLQIHKKSKELKVRDYLFQEFEGFIHDKPLWTGNCDCTHRRRIDFRKLIGNTLLCIEVDENQHKGYNNEDEEIRYDDLYMLHSGKFIFIRFNPDKFKFGEKTCNPTMNTRLVRLKDEIVTRCFRIENELNNDLIEIIKLYYDS